MASLLDATFFELGRNVFDIQFLDMLQFLCRTVVCVFRSRIEQILKDKYLKLLRTGKQLSLRKGQMQPDWSYGIIHSGSSMLNGKWWSPVFALPRSFPADTQIVGKPLLLISFESESSIPASSPKVGMSFGEHKDINTARSE